MSLGANCAPAFSHVIYESGTLSHCDPTAVEIVVLFYSYLILILASTFNNQRYGITDTRDTVQVLLGTSSPKSCCYNFVLFFCEKSSFISNLVWVQLMLLTSYWLLDQKHIYTSYHIHTHHHHIRLSSLQFFLKDVGCWAVIHKPLNLKD